MRHFFGSGGIRSAAAARNFFRYSSASGSPAPVEPVAIDHQSVVVSLFQRRSGLGQGGEAPFDAAGVEEHREAPLLAIPQFLVQFQERVLHRHTVAQQMQMLPGIALAHGRGKIDVELQRIGGHEIGRWIDVGHPRGGGRLERRREHRKPIRPLRHREAGRPRARAYRATAQNAGETPATPPPRCTCPAAEAHRRGTGVHRKDAGPSGGRLRRRLPTGDPKRTAIELYGGE